MKILKVVELFSGIGSQAKALSKIKVDYKVVAISEWDINSIIAYGALHKNKEINEAILKSNTNNKEIIDKLKLFGISADGKKLLKNFNIYSKEKLNRLFITNKITNNLGNISNIDVDDIPNHDLLTYSFPCQDLSLQGKREGLNPNNSSGLLWEVERIIKKLAKDKRLPKYLLMENVPAIFSKRNQKSFNKWKKSLELCGYKNFEQLLNAKYFGVPQNRNRAFMVSILNPKNKFQLNDYDKTKKLIPFSKIMQSENSEFIFVKKNKVDLILNDLVEKNPQVNFNGIKYTKLNNYTNFESENRVFFKEGIISTLTATGAQSRLKFPYFPTNKIRLITPLESWMLMGFSKNDYDKVNSLNLMKKNDLIKQAGNSIVVNVLEYIFKKIVKDMN